MSVGDSVGGNITVPAGGYAAIVPTDGTTWLITNISLTGPFNLVLNAGEHTAIGVQSTVATNYYTFLNNLKLYCGPNGYWSIYNTDSVVHSFEYNGIVINDGTNGANPIYGLASIASNGSYTIQPPVGQEWEINYVVSNCDYGIFWEPSNKTIISNGSEYVWTDGLMLAITNSHYITLKSLFSGNYNMAYAGTRTK